MNKFRSVSRDILSLLSGGLLLFCILSFLNQLNLLADTGRGLRIPYVFPAAIVLMTSGLGINLSVDQLRLKKTDWLPALSFFFACYFLLLQLGLTIFPGFSSCKCTSLSETIANIRDWGRVYPAVVLLILSAAAFALRKRKDAEFPH